MLFLVFFENVKCVITPLSSAEGTRHRLTLLLIVLEASQETVSVYFATTTIFTVR